MNREVQKRYFKEFGISMGFYIVLLIASILVITNVELPKVAQVIVTLIPVIPTIFVVIAVMRALRDSDELQQRIQILRDELREFEEKAEAGRARLDQLGREHGDIKREMVFNFFFSLAIMTANFPI